MPLPVSIVGRSTAPVTHELDAAWLTGFAASVGGHEVHPLFPVCVEWPAVIAAARLDDGALHDDERRRGVHATHDLTIHRLLRAGDVVTTTATVEALEPHRRGTLERLRLDTRDAAGSLVASTVMGSLFLDVGIEGAVRPDSSTNRRSERESRTAVAASAVSTVPLAVAADQARAYSESSRIWNPIHTDARAAASAGLSAPILHGTCTLAMAVSAALTNAGVSDPHALRRIRARFAGMVAMPSTLELRLARPKSVPRSRSDELDFEVFDSHGAAVIRDGVLTFRG